MDVSFCETYPRAKTVVSVSYTDFGLKKACIEDIRGWVVKNHRFVIEFSY